MGVNPARPGATIPARELRKGGKPLAHRKFGYDG
jgi:hypothetical protein